MEHGQPPSAFQFDLEVNPADLLAPPLVVDPPPVVNGSHPPEPALPGDGARFARPIRFDSQPPRAIQEP
jgi:hypothetical protein